LRNDGRRGEREREREREVVRAGHGNWGEGTPATTATGCDERVKGGGMVGGGGGGGRVGRSLACARILPSPS